MCCQLGCNQPFLKTNHTKHLESKYLGPEMTGEHQIYKTHVACQTWPHKTIFYVSHRTYITGFNLTSVITSNTSRLTCLPRIYKMQSTLPSNRKEDGHDTWNIFNMLAYRKHQTRSSNMMTNLTFQNVLFL